MLVKPKQFKIKIDGEFLVNQKFTVDREFANKFCEGYKQGIPNANLEIIEIQQ